MSPVGIAQHRGVIRALTAVLVVIALGGAAFLATVRAGAATSLSLGSAASFAVLGGQSVTNTGPSVINGDLGVSPGSSITGFPPGTVNGTIHATDAVAAQAEADVTSSYNVAAGQAPDANLTGQDLGGLTLTPGVYKFDSTAQLTGTLTLDGQTNADAVFIFQIGSTLITASNSTVRLVNGAQSCNVFWQVGSSATLGTTTSFVGNVLALTSITAVTGATVDGRLLAQNGSVTLDSNVVTKATCAVPTTTSSTLPGATTTSIAPTTTSSSLPGASTTTTSIASATTTSSLPAATTTTSSIPGASTTTSSIPGASTTTSIAGATTTTSSSLPGASTTTTSIASATTTSSLPAATTTTTSSIGGTTTTTSSIGGTTTTSTALAGATTTTSSSLAGITTTSVSATTTTRPGLPLTGSDGRLPLVGALAIALSLVLLALLREARRQ